jgi:hypothetical protein
MKVLLNLGNMHTGRFLFSPYFIETLTALYLASNRIGNLGAPHIADGLMSNKVIVLSLFLQHIHIFVSYRHSLHLTSETIRSVMKEFNLLLKL